MPAKLEWKETGKANSLIFYLKYPEEPKANTLDTLFIGDGGTRLNGEKVMQKNKLGKDSLIILTEEKGLDGNDSKAALIRHIYNIGRSTYVVRKEVLFTGEVNWILRNEYRFTRTRNCK
jgi:hypothetical protein